MTTDRDTTAQGSDQAELDQPPTSGENARSDDAGEQDTAAESTPTESGHSTAAAQTQRNREDESPS